MRKYIEGLVSRAAIIYRVYWLIYSLRFGRGGKGNGFGSLSREGNPEKKEGKKKKVTDKIVLTAYVKWFITSAKDCHWHSR